MDSDITGIIQESLVEVFEMYGNDKTVLKFHKETCLMGKNGILDSLGIVTLIATFEEKISHQYNVSLNLSDNMDAPEGPLCTIEALKDFTKQKIEERG